MYIFISIYIFYLSVIYYAVYLIIAFNHAKKIVLLKLKNSFHNLIK